MDMKISKQTVLYVVLGIFGGERLCYRRDRYLQDQVDWHRHDLD